MTDQLEIYQQVILDHNKKPRNFGKIEDATCEAEGFNPLCGDHLFVYAKLGPESEILDLKFTGSGCAISKASASMMTTALKGQTFIKTQEMIHDFLSLLKGELKDDVAKNKLGKLQIFQNIWKYPSRVKCASLGWYTLRGALEKTKEKISTE